jgi:hypothetical protein
MKYKKFPTILGIAMVVVMTMQACSQALAGGPTATATAPAATATKTATLTRTPRPSVTPNVVATQNADEFSQLLNDYKDKGYISTTDGRITQPVDYKDNWAQIDWFQWHAYGRVNSEFVFKTHFSWETASATPNQSGCGVVFGLQENRDYYAVFLDFKSLLFMMKRGDNLYRVGKTSGSGYADFENPAETDFVLAVSNQKAYVSVDGELTVYTLSVDQATDGGLALSILSGTNREFGTRCESTEMFLWNGK